MAPQHMKRNITLQVPSSADFYSSSTRSSSTSDLEIPQTPRTLYADTFDRPQSAPRSLPSSRPQTERARQKNMKEMIGITTEEDFDKLPLAVRRKYFSTLERLRFAQNSSSLTINDPATPLQRKRSLASRRGIRSPALEPSRHNSIISPRQRLNKSSRQSSYSAADASWFLTLPNKIRKQQFTPEEQIYYHNFNTDSVILDAADEAIYKANRRASRNLTPIINLLPTSPSSRGSMESTQEARVASKRSSVAAAMYESFRWMDEEDDLDLKLALDDYHANLDGAVLPTPKSSRRPSFRRNMSITKIPFGRTSSVSSILPSSPMSIQQHNRQQSRAVSLMAKTSEPRTSIDHFATHYQDPEARLKLRVYLASPQKFDEAIEFGFPSLEGVSDTADKENKPPRSRKASRDGTIQKSTLSRETKTFFDDDAGSLLEDDASMIDPDSPITPSEPSGTFKASHQIRHNTPRGNLSVTDFSHLGIKRPKLHKHAESYSQSLAGSREMTLRMTLTRPDLRADESKIYGWQNARTKSPLGEEGSGGLSTQLYEVKGPLGGVDGWGPAERDDGVVKRFWKKVKSQRKSS